MKENKFFFFACQFHKNSIVKESSNFRIFSSLSTYPFHKSFKFYYKRFKIFQKYIFLSKFQKNNIFLARNFHTDNFSKISGRKIERKREKKNNIVNHLPRIRYLNFHPLGALDADIPRNRRISGGVVEGERRAENDWHVCRKRFYCRIQLVVSLLSGPDA